MSKITWLGEPGGPPFTEWNGSRFDVGVPVETSDPYFLRKALGNPFFTVSDDDVSARAEPPEPSVTVPQPASQPEGEPGEKTKGKRST